MNIDKFTIIQTWNTKKFHKNIVLLRKTMMEQNPEFEFVLFDDQELNNSIEEYFDKDVVNCYFKLNHYTPRADLWRYLMVHKFGCVYLDIDSLILKNIANLLKSNKTILTMEPNNVDFITWILIYKKNDEILSTAAQMIIDNIKADKFKNDVMNLSGPSLLSRAIREVLGLPPYPQEIDIKNPNIRDLFESENCLYLPNKDHDEYFAFTHEYNHLLRKRRKSFFKLYKNDMKHWQNFQRENSLY